MIKPKLLDLFCGAGGASMGYYRAGFEVYGIDNKPQPHYPFPFLLMDALEAMDRLLRGEGLTFNNDETLYLQDFFAYHASPPCQKYSIALFVRIDHKKRRQEHVDLIDIARIILLKTGKPFVIENVPHSPLINYIKLHGTMFGLKTNKERWFELHGFNILLLPTRWNSTKGMVKDGKFAGIMQHSQYPNEKYRKEELAVAYLIDWGLTRHELRQAIPPAYTEYIGRELIKRITV